MAFKCDGCDEAFRTRAGLFLHEAIRHKGLGLQKIYPPWDEGSKIPWNSLNPDEKRIRIRNQEIARLTRHGKIKKFYGGKAEAKLDVYVDEFAEVWKVDSKEKHHKICGAHKKGKPGLLCCLPAGFRTEHGGYGRCRFHSGTSEGNKGSLASGPANTYLRAYLHQPGHSLAESFARVDKLSSEELFDTENVLRMAYVLLDDQLKEGIQYAECEGCGTQVPLLLKKEATPELRKTLELIAKTIESRYKIASMMVVDITALSLFINEVMSVVQQYIPREDWLEAVEKLHSDVVLRLGDRDHITAKGEIVEAKVEGEGE